MAQGIRLNPLGKILVMKAQYIHYFRPEHIRVIDEAVAISEEIVSDRMGLTSTYWKRNPYEVKTLKETAADERPGHAFAHLVRYGKGVKDKSRGSDAPLDFYRICLHDHRILTATEKKGLFDLKPFLVYILSHELLHITRFAGFRCHMDSRRRGIEEGIVHRLTGTILKSVPLSGLGQVVSYFEAAA